MAEVIGIVTGSLQLLDKLVKLSAVAASAMDAPDEIATLSRDLGELKLIFDTKVKDLPKEGLVVLEEPIVHFENDLETLLKGLNELDLKKTKRIRWATSKSKDYSRAAARLENYKSLFELAIAGDTREVGKRTLEIVHSVREDVRLLAEGLDYTEKALSKKIEEGVLLAEQIRKD
ncbi:hypothetical protein BJ508DRAFT_181163 [Ascobolus immersus RN42]|uniref:NACHT-NTPase and P-loop NTPases N-terminal domain-containing protein n=1 Tax=Ascobolus immersus RN42 TaxID=1160509 RepID=A0A3N4HSD7_ASCIM|nr:hypothetical protein BJ508DRAFT_181163 [Ascobolus immersus RN42]